jgi:hypothetical protein
VERIANGVQTTIHHDARARLAEVTKQAAALLRQGLTWDEARTRLQFDSLGSRFVRENDPTAVAFRDCSVRTALTGSS